MTSGPRLLIVIESWNDLVASQLKSILKELPPSSSFFLISESSSITHAVKDTLVELDVNPKCLFINQFLETVFNECEYELKEKFEYFHTQDADLWMQRVSELNFSSIIWQKYMFLRCVQEVVKVYSIDHVVPICPDEVVKTFYRTKFNSNVTLTSDLRSKCRSHHQRAKTFFNALFLVVKNFIYEVVGLFLARLLFQEYVSNHYRKVYYCNYPSNWSDTGRPSYRFFDIIGDEGIRDNWLLIISAAHSNSDVITNPLNIIRFWWRFRGVKNISLLQTYGSLRGIVYAYICGAMRALRSPSIELLSNSIGLSAFHLRCEAWVDFSKQLSLESNALACFENKLESGLLMVPVYELVEGRVICGAARTNAAIVAGQQHSSAGRWGCMRSILAVAAMRDCKALPLPSVYFVEGQHYKELHERHGLRNIHVAGASRVSRLSHYRARRTSGDQSTVLVLLELHRWHALAKFAIDLATSCCDCIVVVRSHPRSRFKVNSYFSNVPELPDNISVDCSSSLNDCLEKNSPAIILAGETGSSSELACAGLPVFILNIDFIAMLSPITSLILPARAVDSASMLLNVLADQSVQQSPHDAASDLIDQASQLIECIGTEANNQIEVELDNILRDYNVA